MRTGSQARKDLSLGVTDDFRAFRDSYVIKKDTMDSLSYRYQRMTKQLHMGFWNTESETAHSLYIGYYGRDTGLCEVDLSKASSLTSARLFAVAFVLACAISRAAISHSTVPLQS